MTKRIILSALLILAILATPIIAIASDISGAQWYGLVTVSNNATATTNVATTANISTENLIAGNYLNSTANNTVMRNSSGADVPFQPGYTDVNLWSMFVPTIGADSYLSYILYTAESSGGELRYFPGAGGMAVSDNFTLELGDDFTIEQRGFFDTASGSNKNLVIKDATFRSYISASQEITSSINVTTPLTLRPDAAGDEENISNSTSGVGLHWQDVNDQNDATLVWELGAAYARDLYECADSGFANVVIDNVEVFARAQTAGAPPAQLKTAIKTGGVAFDGAEEALPGAGWVNYGTVYFNNPNTGNQWTVAEIDALQIGVSLKTNGSQCSEVWIEITYANAVIATGISSDEYTIATSMKDDPLVANYDDSCNIGISMGSGILPVRVLAKEALTVTAGSVTFSNIDTLVADWDAKAVVNSRHLVVFVNAASPDAVANRNVNVRFNGDALFNYSYEALDGTGAVPGAAINTNSVLIDFTRMPGTTYAGAFGGGVLLIPHAFNTSNHKATLSFGGAVEDILYTTAGRWANTAAITSVTLVPAIGSFDTNSTFILGVIDERYLVEESILGADGNFAFDNIPGTGHDLAVIGYCRTDRVFGVDTIYHQINNDAVDANYLYQNLWGVDAAPGATAAATRSIGIAPGHPAAGNEFGAFLATYSQYANGINDPHYLSLSGFHEEAGVASAYVYAYSGRRNNVAAITKIEYIPGTGANFKSGSMMSLYRVPRYVIDRQVLTAVAPTITFSNIPQTYDALQLNIYTRSDLAAINEDVEITINADGAVANYDSQYLEGTGAGPPTSARNAASQVVMAVPAANEGANEFGGGVITLNQYATTVGHKHFFTISGTQENQVILMSSRWEDTDAITSIALDLAGANNFIVGSVFELVGVMPTQAFMIEVDSVVEAIEAANANTVVDNANNWTFLENDSMLYLEYQEITIDDVLQQDVDWEYGSIFYDTSRPVLHFPGGADSSVDCGAIHNAATKLWVSSWFRLDTAFGVGSPANQYLFGKVDGGNANSIYTRLDPGDGKLHFFKRDGGAQTFDISTVATTWTADEWHHVLFSISSFAGARLIVDGAAAVTDADTSAVFNGNDVIFGAFRVGHAQGIIGEMTEWIIGTDDLTPAEETALYNWTAPGDEVNYWYVDEGTGVTIFDYGSGGNNGTADTDNSWEDGDIANHQTRNNATPTFRSASSDPDVSANMTAFLPIAEAKAPGYALGVAPPFISSTPNITGNFTTVPPIGTFPLAGVISTVANATGTPAQLPLLIIAVFIIIAVSLSMSALMRQYGSGTVIVKIIAVTAVMGIFIALRNFGIDFWMLVVFLIIGIALSMASRQLGWS